MTATETPAGWVDFPCTCATFNGRAERWCESGWRAWFAWVNAGAPATGSLREAWKRHLEEQHNG